ncbi:hypothetical protein [Desulfocurvibacter africanus]|uniref:Uncharacterized protein n=1 Tax=Desulfocurvibacter africanus subsp. africanus str. Walvis Bay TaxID=690850 RepID=F3YW32_DESAF|nr:hypothetical protein [Desulfocurvibacter africanus]EGJ49062.1 hypothetical protein Desaf_0710 [Desulfocurvibacter africanus subsp. africanus str. Walvis Bay]
MAADGCSGGVDWLWRVCLGRRPPWTYCCDEHDLAYEEAESLADLRLADRRLRDCLRQAGRPVRSWIYYAAVRLCGWWYWKRYRESVAKALA